MKSPPCFEDAETKRIIRNICDEHRIDTHLLKDLCELIQDRSGEGVRLGIDNDIAGLLSRFINERSPEA